MKFIKLIAPLLAAIAFAGCGAILEKDISKQKIKLLSPGPESSSDNTIQTFRWQELEGVVNYRLQIGSPSLSDATNFYLDTLTAKTSFTVDLFRNINNSSGGTTEEIEERKFEWTVTGENAEYTTDTTNLISRTITIKADNNSTIEKPHAPILDLPRGEQTIPSTSTSTSLAIKFTWRRSEEDSDLRIKSYQFFLFQNGIPYTSRIVPASATEPHTIESIDLNIAKYSWTVQAIEADGDVGETAVKVDFEVKKAQ